jgi:hypothetical protein
MTSGGRRRRGSNRQAGRRILLCSDDASLFVALRTLADEHDRITQGGLPPSGLDELDPAADVVVLDDDLSVRAVVVRGAERVAA